MGKYLSRAKRASKMAQGWRDVAQKLQEELDNDKVNLEQCSTLTEDIDYSDLDELKSELENWRDGMSGTNLEHSNKFSMLEEAISSIDCIDTSVLEATTFEDQDEVESLIQSLESAADELESVEFPGMYS